MEYKIHKVGAEAKIKDIAELYNVTVEQIKKINPDVYFFKSFLGTTEYVGYNQTLKIPLFEISDKENKQLKKTLDFQKVARYRCTQNNITKALEDVTFSSSIKTQYLLSAANEEPTYFHSLLEDYVYQISPKELGQSFELIKEIELLKNDIVFTQKRNADFLSIYNQVEIEKKWVNFQMNKLPSIEFFKQLKNQNGEAARDFIRTADNEFALQSNLKDTLSKNLFYHILLKANVGADLTDFSFTQPSQIFPKQELSISINKNIVSEKDDILTIKLTGELQKDNLDDKELKKLYDEIYKPMLKFAYSEFDYIYRITYTINTKTGVLLEAKAAFSEKVKNNFECVTQFEINQVEL